MFTEYEFRGETFNHHFDSLADTKSRASSSHEYDCLDIYKRRAGRIANKVSTMKLTIRCKLNPLYALTSIITKINKMMSLEVRPPVAHLMFKSRNVGEPAN